ncbi:MAG: CaiB/BaiF CoA-transferase family protein, partial [Gammaproteobacteria bacterium]|nr:CaiB/BaiF CoA-transferase family protein [Gammaproteobacteria bacterium]
RERNSRLVYVSISGFGEKGPYSHKRVYDPIIQGLSGATDIQADRDTGRPNMFRIILADKVSALTAAQAVSSALFHRERTGEGQHIKLSMLDATVAFFWPEGMQGLTFAEKETDVRKTFSSIDLIYETENGYITISVISDKEWKGICVALNCEELISDERFVTSLARRRNSEERRAVIGDLVKGWTSEEILEELDRNDVPCAPLLDRTELMDHPQLMASKTVEKIEFEGFGEVRQAKPAAEFSLTQSDIRIAAPKLGQHSVEILKGLGYDHNNLDELLKAEVILQSS